MIAKLFTVTLELLVTPLLVLSAIVLLGVYTVSQPTVFAFIYEQISVHEGGVQRDGVLIAKAMRGSESFELVNKRLEAGRMGPREIYHFDDVRNKLRASSLLMLGFFLCVLISSMAARIRWTRVIVSSITWYLTLAVASVVWVSISFRSFFRTLHWWIFQDNTWMLPKGCYSLQLYPYLVWQVLGAVVLSGTLLILIVPLIYNSILRRRLKSRSREELESY